MMLNRDGEFVYVSEDPRLRADTIYTLDEITTIYIKNGWHVSFKNDMKEVMSLSEILTDIVKKGIKGVEACTK